MAAKPNTVISIDGDSLNVLYAGLSADHAIDVYKSERGKHDQLFLYQQMRPTRRNKGKSEPVGSRARKTVRKKDSS